MKKHTILVGSIFLACFAPKLIFAQPYAVGNTSITFIDSSRGNRAVLSNIYYPATTAGLNTAVAGTSQKFPVISFGHGLGLSTAIYQYLWDSLVPQGFILVLPATEGGSSPNFSNFATDLRFALKSMRLQGGIGSSLFFGKVGDRGAIGGHSMGGGCSIKATSNDTTANCLFNFAAAPIFSFTIATGVKMPALMFGGEKDCACPPSTSQKPFYDSLHSICKALVVLDNADHCQFAAPDAGCLAAENSCGVFATIPDTLQQQRVLNILIPFLKWQLVSDGSAKDSYESQIAASSNAVTYQSCTVAAVPGHSDRTLFENISICPNPAGSSWKIHFSVATTGMAVVQVYNLYGDIVNTQNVRIDTAGAQTVAMNTNNLKPGNYMIKLSFGGEYRVIPVTIVR